MKKFYLPLVWAFLGMLTFSACSDDDEYIPPFNMSIESQDDQLSIMKGQTLVLTATSNLDVETTYTWLVNGQATDNRAAAANGASFTFTPEEIGSYTIEAKGENQYGTAAATVTVEVYGKYKYGTFILNENGDNEIPLLFIDPKGQLSPDAYLAENGTGFGSRTQDLYIANNKLYVIAQNGNNFITVANAETLEKEATYNSELQGKVSWPSHIAVLDDDHIYLRDNGGIKLFQPSTSEVTLIDQSAGAAKKPMAVANGKLFAGSRNKLIMIEKGQTAVSQVLELEGGNVLGVIKSSDGNLWVSTKQFIYKVNPDDCSIIGSNEITDAGAQRALGNSTAASANISAKGDTLYMSGTSTKIFRHIFSTKETRLMVDAKTFVPDHKVVYNTCAVNPVTGEVILNTLKNFGADFTINNINVFDLSGEEPVLKATYQDYTRFPSGVFFTYNFN